MFKNYLKIALRSLWKNRLFTGINVVGLSLGLACATVLILFVQRGITFDQFHQDTDQIYFVQMEDRDGRYNQTVYPILDQLLKTYPEVETGTHIQGWNNAWINYKGKDIQQDTKYVEDSFFDIFSFKLKYGDPKTALKRRESVVISEQVAESLFGDRNPVGETVTVNDTSAFTVTAVLEPIPANSSIQFEVLVPIANLEANQNFARNADWYNTFATVYLKLQKGSDVKKLESQFPAFVKTHFSSELQNRKIHLTPLKDFIHHQNPSFKWLLTGAVTIVVFIVSIISINLINLTTALSFARAKEVAVRKVTGSTLRQILLQFWTESGLVLVCALIISLIVGVQLLVPKFNEFRKERMQLEFDWSQDFVTVLLLTGIVCLIAFLAGTYPALYLNRLDIRETIKGKISSGPHSKGRLRSSLIVVQLVITFGLVIGSFTVRKQIGFMREANLGFEKSDVVVVQSDLQYENEEAAMSQFKPILAALNENAAVADVTCSGVVPTRYWSNYNIYQSEVDPDKEVRFKHVGTGSKYVETYGIKMLEGREFSDELDKDGANHPVLINESAMKAMGWTTAVGKRLRQKNNPDVYTVVGVMKDFHYQDLKEKIEPLLHWYEGPAGLNSYLSIKFHDIRQGGAVLADLEMKMKQIPAKKPFKYFYLTDEIHRQYNHLDGIWKMLNFVTALSIVIALAGIFGLITLVANQRTKEVGIRKVLGSSVVSIVILLCKDFIVLVLISIIIGIPLGYAFMTNYLSSFEYHVKIEWFVFALTALLSMSLTVLTVGLQSVKAALMDPVKALRNE
jgi:putative ABC transport system permease protein